MSATPANIPASRGILYVKWGASLDALLDRSLKSVRTHHPELPIHIHKLPDNATLLDKADMFRFSPFQETLYLDVDTIVFDRLDFGFEMARRHHLACAICECPWARRYPSIQGDMVEYNTGVLFFTKAAQPIFDTWAVLARTVDSSVHVRIDNKEQTLPCNDQAAFALAVAQSPFLPFILPSNWNFRIMSQRSWWGPIKIWHAPYEPAPPLLEWNRRQLQPGAIFEFLSIQ